MIIDFHTHVFPDKIAAKTIDYLAKKCDIPPYSDGSVNGLLQRLGEAKVDIGVTLPVVTSPKQFESINRFAGEINAAYEKSSPRLISFAGIHPLCEDIEGKMKAIKNAGFIGVKIHPDYQETFIDDDGYVRIMRAAAENDLVVVTHSGVDGGYRDLPVKCTPERVLRLLKKAPHSKLVLAHLGANEMFGEVLESLCGLDVYFDTAFILKYVDKEIFKRILDKHGKERILFATDSPWSNIKDDVEKLRSFELGKETEEMIFSQNAKKLLGI